MKIPENHENSSKSIENPRQNEKFRLRKNVKNNTGLGIAPSARRMSDQRGGEDAAVMIVMFTVTHSRLPGQLSLALD